MYAEKIRKFIGHCWVYENGETVADALVRGKGVNNHNLPLTKHNVTPLTPSLPVWVYMVYIAYTMST
jgi:small GTP-binding protein